MCPTGSLFYTTTRNVNVAGNVHRGVHVLNGQRFLEMHPRQNSVRITSTDLQSDINTWLIHWRKLQNRTYPRARQYLAKLSVFLTGNLMQYAKIRDFPADNSVSFTCKYQVYVSLNPLYAKLNPICHLLALLGAHHILHVSRIRVNFEISDGSS